MYFLIQLCIILLFRFFKKCKWLTYSPFQISSLISEVMLDLTLLRRLKWWVQYLIQWTGTLNLNKSSSIFCRRIWHTAQQKNAQQSLRGKVLSWKCCNVPCPFQDVLFITNQSSASDAVMFQIDFLFQTIEESIYTEGLKFNFHD